MEAASHGKHICQVINHVNRSIELLDEGVNEVISEDVSLLCADTSLMIAEMEIARARASIDKRRDALNNV